MKKNIIANYIGRFWGFLSGFLFTPLYIHYLGIEAFSIISFALVITGLMSLLDAGITTTLSREFALKSTYKSNKVNSLSTFEIIYFAIALLVTLIIFIYSNQIAINWLNLDKIDPLKVSYYLKLIGIGIASQLLGNFYNGGLMGLEKQVKANFYKIGWGIARNALVVIILIYSPSLELFFIWQTVTTIIYAFLLRRSLINELNTKIPLFRKPVIDVKILKRNCKFAGGVLLIAIVASLNTQMDKLVISKLLPISILGYYTLAISLSQSIVSLVMPISATMIPRFTSLYSEKKATEVTKLYRKITLLVSIIVLSFGFNIIFFSKELIWIWTGNINLANSAYQFVPYLTFGSIMLSFQFLPYSIAIAKGYTRLNNYLGIASLIITVPGYWLMTKFFGAIGAAITWGLVQTLITPIYIYFINKRFLPSIKSVHQILRSFVIPAFIAFLSTFLFSQLNHFRDHRVLEFLWIGMSTLASLIVSVLLLFKKEEYFRFLPSLRIKLKQ